MRFSIGDMLIMSFVVALAVLALVGTSKAKRLTAQAANARENERALKRSVSFGEMRLRKFGPKMDYIRQIQAAAEPAIAGFEAVRQRYCKVEPVPNKVVIRSVPEYSKDLETSINRWRISVPSGQPVYLRSGIQRDLEHTEESKLDTVDWLTETPFQDSNAYEIQLEPGIIDLWMLTSILGSRLELRLGDQQLLSTVFDDDHSSRAWSGPSAREPLSFSLAEKTKNMIRLNFGGDSPRYEYWIWFSSKPIEDGYKPFPLKPIVPIASIDPDQKTAEATADE